MSRSRSRTRSLSVEFLSCANPDGPNELEGLAANVKLLLKLLQEHQNAGDNDGASRQPQRVASMLTIIDDIRSRIQSSKTSARIAELRRCNTDLRRSAIPVPPKDKKPPLDTAGEDICRLRRELLGSMSARKSLENMFSGVGKEKELIGRELAKKVHELTSAEELLNDLKAQNEVLSEKVRVCCNEHEGRKGGAIDVLLQERNKALSEQLLKAMDAYRSTRRKLKEERVERDCVLMRLFGMAEEAAAGEERVRRLREKLGLEEDGELVVDELCSLEKTFAAFFKRLSPRGTPK